MLAETERLLEFDKIVRLLSGYTQTGTGRDRALALAPLDNDTAIRQSLTEVSEVVTLLETSSAPSLGGLFDLKEVLAALRVEGAWLDVEALQAVLSSLEVAASCRQYFRQPNNVPELSALLDELDPLISIAASIRSCIDERGDILDSASVELARTRREINSLRLSVRQEMEEMLNSERFSGALQDRIVTERSGRYVLPVKADFKGQVRGFVHDTSATGQTLFVEPEQTLEKNNRLQSLLSEEKQEELRILQELSWLVAEERQQILINQEILTHLDLRVASGKFARACGGQVPHLVAEPIVDLRAAVHPLLLFASDGRPEAGPVVPIDLKVGADRSVLIMSGPNTGGKTVALKTVGLLLLMLRAGLPVPCHPDSRLHLFSRLFADIGDEQSIEEHLSTFSGHLTRLSRILKEADDDSLVLFDEAGTGTDPGEGAALIIAAVDSLRERGSKVVLTTHLNLLKGYAQLHDDVENAAVEFDPDTLRPTYRLHYGIPGESGAFTIARHYGLPEDVLARAESYLGTGEQEGRELISRLNELVRVLEAERSEASAELESARRERNKRKTLLREVEEQKSELLNKALRRGEQLVREAEREVRELLSRADQVERLPEQAEVVSAVKGVGEKLKQARKPVAETKKQVKNTEPGEILKVATLGVDGEVVEVAGNKVELNVQGKKMRLTLDKVEQYSPRRFAAKKNTATVRGKVERDRFDPRLLLVGKRVDAAVPELERFLDDALLEGVSEVEVVHGSGEGILRKAVREHLAAHRGVTAFHGAGPNQGGENVTIVEMRAK
ncbi:MAG: endonuclease MutS2 [Desulfuromonas sp.]|nr:MAG: endonuclease MutS2 [Desulfuromonas sp.]